MSLNTFTMACFNLNLCMECKKSVRYIALMNSGMQVPEPEHTTAMYLRKGAKEIEVY